MKSRLKREEAGQGGVQTGDWEIEDIHRHFPKHTHDEVLEALEDCQQELGTAVHRDKLVECMSTRLSPQAADGVD